MTAISQNAVPLSGRLKKLEAPVLGALARAMIMPRQLLLGWQLVRWSLGRRRLHVVARAEQDFGRVLGFSPGQMSLLLKGGTDRGSYRRGLVEMGIVGLAPAPGGGVVLTVYPDYRRWVVEWRYAEGADRLAAVEWDLIWADYGRQMESPEIAERFGLNEMVLEQSVIDISNYLGAQASERVVERQALSASNNLKTKTISTAIDPLCARPVAVGGGLLHPGSANATERVCDGSGGVSGGGVARGSLTSGLGAAESSGGRTGAGQAAGAGLARVSCAVGGPVVVAPNGGNRPPAAGRADGFIESRSHFYRIGKRDSPEKAGVLSNREVPARARLIGKLDSGIGKLANCPSWSMRIGEMESVMIEELKVKVQGDEREFMWAGEMIIGRLAWRDGCIGRGYGDGKVWRLRWRDKASRELCRSVFAETLMNRETVGEAAGYVEDVWQRLGGAALDRKRMAGHAEKSKESFSTH